MPLEYRALVLRTIAGEENEAWWHGILLVLAGFGYAAEQFAAACLTAPTLGLALLALHLDWRCRKFR